MIGGRVVQLVALRAGVSREGVVVEGEPVLVVEGEPVVVVEGKPLPGCRAETNEPTAMIAMTQISYVV